MQYQMARVVRDYLGTAPNFLRIGIGLGRFSERRSMRWGLATAVCGLMVLPGCGGSSSSGGSNQPKPTLPPTPSPGGPYTGTVGIVVAFSGSGSSDPQGQPQTYAWNFGDGSVGNRRHHDAYLRSSRGPEHSDVYREFDSHRHSGAKCAVNHYNDDSRDSAAVGRKGNGCGCVGIARRFAGLIVICLRRRRRVDTLRSPCSVCRRQRPQIPEAPT